jgi:PAS domain S-box-containing protein
MSEDIALGEPRRPLVLTILLLAVLAVLVAYLAARHLESVRIRLEFERAANDRVREINGEIDAYINDLHAISAFFRASEEVTRDEFQEFTHPLHARHRGLRAFDWVPRVRHDERAAYETRVREEIPGFEITELADGGGLKPASARAEYYPIDYIEPRNPVDEPIRGFDLGSLSESSESLFASRDAGSLAIAGPVPLITDPIDPSAYLLFLPHYEGKQPVTSLVARRERFAGVIVAVLQLSDALRGALDSLSPESIDVEVADHGTAVAMYRTFNPEERTLPLPTRWSHTIDYSRVEALPFGDRELEVRCRATPEFIALHSSVLPWVVLAGGGFFLTALGFYFLRLRREIRARRRANKALRESERRYRVLVEHAPEAIVVYDVERGRFIDVNENAVRLFKRSREQLLELSPADLSPRLQPDGRSSASMIKALLDEALAGGAPSVSWVHRDGEGRDIPCEVRLVRLPPFEKSLVRGSVIDVSERRQSELRQLIMARELDHRVKNNLAEVLALVEQSGTSASSYEEFREAFAGRVRAMARTHEALAERRWHGVPLKEVANLTLGPYEASGDNRIIQRGAPVMLTPTASSALGMMLHELAANAAKYGALAVASGRVELSWQWQDDGGLEILWRESGGPPVSPPERTGFGTRLVRGVVTHELGGSLNMVFEQQGFYCEIHLPRDIEQESGALE